MFGLPKMLHSAVANSLTFENQVNFLPRRSGFDAQVGFYCLL